MERKSGRAQGGFTLLEVCIALGLLGFTLLGIFELQFYAMRSNTLSRGSTTALHIAQDRMEALLAEPYDSALLVDALAGNPLNSTDQTDYSDNTVTDAKGNGYTLVTNISDNAAAPDTKTIEVIVVWGNNARQCAVVSLKRRVGA